MSATAMILWFAAVSVAIVWKVFQSPALDYRFIAIGSLIPLTELAIGHTGMLHTLALPVAILLILVGLTGRRRLLRRRVIALPIGLFLHLLLDGTWTDPEAFWWPLFGFDFGDEPLPVVRWGLFSLVLEAVGVGVAVWCYRVFGLEDPGRRAVFTHTGRLSLRGAPC